MNRLTTEKKELIYQLHEQDTKLADIAMMVGLSRSTVSIYLMAKRKGYDSITEYQYALLEKRKMGPGSYKRFLVQRKGYASLHDYHEALAKRRGYQSGSEYQRQWKRRRSQQTLEERLHQQELNQKKRTEEGDRARVKMSALLKSRLQELDRDQLWLAARLGITPSAVSRYVHGKTKPRKRLWPEFFAALELPYRTIDEVVETT